MTRNLLRPAKRAFEKTTKTSGKSKMHVKLLYFCTNMCINMNQLEMKCNFSCYYVSLPRIDCIMRYFVHIIILIV